MKRHIEEDHKGEESEAKFTWKVHQKHFKPLERQLHEAVNIKHTDSKESLNSKTEILGQRIRRIELQAKNFHQCKTCKFKSQEENIVQEHEKKFHQVFKCNLCSQDQFGYSGMNQHMKVSHGSQNAE